MWQKNEKNSHFINLELLFCILYKFIEIRSHSIWVIFFYVEKRKGDIKGVNQDTTHFSVSFLSLSNTSLEPSFSFNSGSLFELIYYNIYSKFINEK